MGWTAAPTGSASGDSRAPAGSSGNFIGEFCEAPAANARCKQCHNVGKLRARLRYGTYELQKGLDHTKHIWMHTTKPVIYLRWATTWRQWIFDNGESRAFEILFLLS